MTHEFRIALAVMPEGIDSTLTNEVRMLKSALLYGEHVTAFSPGLSVAQLMRNSLDHSPSPLTAAEREALLRQFPDDPDAHSLIAAHQRFETLVAKSVRTAEEESFLENFVQYMIFERHGFEREFIPDQLAMLDEAGWVDIQPALDAGLLTIEPLVTDNDYIELGDQFGRVLIERYFAHIQSILQDSTAYPLLDEFSADVASNSLGRSLLPEPRLERHARDVRLAAGLIAGLPMFEQATIADILDIRQELREPLERFRTAIADLGDHLSVSSLSSDFFTEVDELRRLRIDPVVRDLEQAVQENTFLRQLGRRLINDSKALIGATFSLGVGTTTGIINGLSAGGLSAAAAAAAAMSDVKRNSDAIEKMGFYFLHRANTALERQT